MGYRERKTIKRETFEREYRGWLLTVARDIAHQIAFLSPTERKEKLEAYEKMKNLGAVFRPLSDDDRIGRLVGAEISAYVFVETETLSFFPSLFSDRPEVLDLAVAMNRRFYIRGLWFSIISLNSEYIRLADDKLLAFALEHELEMSRLYEEVPMEPQPPEKKLWISELARERSTEKLEITPTELIDEQRLMLSLSNSQPLVPKPYAEMALLFYLEENFDQLKDLGVKSRNEDEDAFGSGLYREFLGWSDFSRRTYHKFVMEIAHEVNEAHRGYA